MTRCHLRHPARAGFTYKNGSDSDNGDNATKYTYQWYDGAVQGSIQHDKSYS